MFLANLTFGAFSFLGLFMMFIILLQRGRGGGLAGAFGGAGGQSAFGTRAGDVFTKITVVVAVLWVALACASIYAFRAAQASRFKEGDKANNTPSLTAPKDDDTKKTPPAKANNDNPKTDDNPIKNKPAEDNGVKGKKDPIEKEEASAEKKAPDAVPQSSDPEKPVSPTDLKK